MAFDAGVIEARLTIDTAQASAELDKIEARVKALEDKTHTVKLTASAAQASADLDKLAAKVKALEGKAHVVAFSAVTGQASADVGKLAAEVKALEKPHVVKISAVFDDSAIAKARRAFLMLDNAVSYDAMQRLRSSPQGSVLGALNALFSPHPVTGGPSPQQAASNGLLGQIFSPQGGQNTAEKGGGTTVLREVVTGTLPPQQGNGNGSAAADAAAAGDLADAATAEKAAAADEAAAAADLQASASGLRDAANSLQRAAVAQTVSLAGLLGGKSLGTGGAGAAAGGAAAGSRGGGTAVVPPIGTSDDVTRLNGLQLAAMNAAMAMSGLTSQAHNATPAVDAVGAAAETAKAGVDQITQSTGNASKSVSNVNIVSGNWFRTLTNIGGVGIPLFGGALGQLIPALDHADSGILKLAGHLVNTTNGWHLMAEAVIETIAIWGPATVAAVAFGLAAAPSVEMVYKQLQNMNTAATGTGQSFQSLATKGQSVTAAVRPTVLEAFGIGLQAIQSRSGTLAPVLAQLGGAFDQLAAKAAIAFESKAGGTFMQKASDDLLKLVDSFTAVGSIIGTLMKAVPGYAEVLLNFGDAGLHAGAAVVSGIEPVLAAFLKLHGAILYGGLTGTAAAWVFPKIVDAASGAALGVATAAEKILGSENSITKGALGLGGALEGLSAGPVIAGVGLLAGAIAAVVLYLKAGGSAASDFGKTVQDTLSKTAVTALPQALASATAQANAKLAASQQQLSSATDQLSHSTGNYVVAGRAGIQYTSQAAQTARSASDATRQYGAVQQQLSDQSKNLNLNLAAIAGTYGTTIPGALALASGAQVGANQLLGKGASNWAVISTMVSGYIAQLKVMVPGTGALNQALNALNVTQSQQITAAQKLTQAYTQWIGIVTGGDSAFTSFEQGLTTLTDQMNGGSAAGVKLTTTSGKLSEQQKLLGTALIGTSTSALAARQAFDSQVTSAVTLYGNLQTMAAASGDTAAAQQALASAGKDVVAQLLPLAAGSQAATAEVFALAQIAGYQGADSFKQLTQWVGSAKGAEADLNKQTTTLTISSANLTQAAKNLSAAMSSEVASGEAAAIAGATNLTQIQGQLATAVENSNGQFSQAAVALAGTYYQALVKSGEGATTAQQDVDAYLTRLGATPSVIDNVNASLAGILTPAITGTGDAASTAAGKIESQLIADLKSIGSDTPAVNTAIGNFTNAIIGTGDASVSTQSARDQLIKDLENAGLNARDATAMVNGLQQQIDGLKGKTVNVGLTASASGIINAVVSGGGTLGQGTKAAEASLQFSAAGGYISGPGGPTSDSVPAMLSNGEYVIQASSVSKYGTGMLDAVNAGRFASGGMVNLAGPEQWASGQESSWASSVAEAWAKQQESAFNAAVAAANAAAAAAVPPVATAGSAGGIIATMMKNMAAARGWTGAQWNALYAVEQREAGFNMTATNPSSGAYGLAQFINGPSEYAQYGGDATTATGQITAMLNYIQQRYGSPESAWAHESTYGWYGNGGWVNEPVLGRGMNSGRGYVFGESGREMVTPASQVSASQNALAALGTKLDRLIRVTEQVPAGVGSHVGSAINGASHDASFRSRYPRNS